MSWFTVKKDSCPYIRTYATHLSLDTCISYLSSQNPRDICEFEFWYADNRYYIKFKDFADQWRRIRNRERFMRNSVYSITMQQREQQLLFTVQFEYVLSPLVDSPQISYTILDEFFSIKLDAKKWWATD